MQEKIEKKFFSNTSGEPKSIIPEDFSSLEGVPPGGWGEDEDGEGDGEGDEETLLIEQNDKDLTKEVQEVYGEELEKIVELAKTAGFKEVQIVAGEGWYVRLRKPDTLFFSKNSLDNFRELSEFVEKNTLYQGVIINFSEMKKCFEKPKIDIYKNLVKANRKLKRLKEEIIEKKVETDKKKLLEEAYNLNVLEGDINKLDMELRQDPRDTLSESEIKKMALKFVIEDILHTGIEKNKIIDFAILEESEDKKEISDAEYRKQFLKMTSPILKRMQETFPSLAPKTIQNLVAMEAEIAEEIGKKYLEQKRDEQEKRRDEQEKKEEEINSAMYG